jgi:tetratricopeptide (TPR) repeat protein
VHEELEDRLRTLLSPPAGKRVDEEPTVDDVFEHVLARIEEDLGHGGVQSAMESIWASRGGLYQDELLAIAGIAPATWAAMQNALDEALYESGGRIQFGHDYLRKAVEDRYGLSETRKVALHRRLAEWFAGREVDERVASELPWQWRQAQAREELVACLLGREVFEHEWQRDEYELLGYWLWTGEDIEAAYEAAWIGSVGDLDEEESARFAGNLGSFLRTAGFFGEFTEVLHRRSLESREKVLGPEHPDTLSSVNNLGNLLSDKGEYHEAEALLRRALESCEKILGPEHPGTLSTANNLGTTLFEKGDSKKKNTPDSQTVEIQMIGPEPPGMLKSVKAELLIRCVFERREKLLGREHPETLSSACNLGALLKQNGDLSGAEALYRRALEGIEKNLGSDHPDTLRSVNNLGNLLSDKGDYAGAETLFRRALEGREKALGAEHPETTNSIDSLGMLEYRKRNFSAAKLFFSRSLEVKEKALGPAHPDTLRSIGRLAQIYHASGDSERSISLLIRELEGYQKLLGPVDPTTLGSFNRLVDLLLREGENIYAEKLLRGGVFQQEKSLGPNHPNTLNSIKNLGTILCENRKYTESEPLLRRALKGEENTLGPENPHTLMSVNYLGHLLNATNRRPEALALLRHYADLSDDSRDAVAYNLACYECLEGNHDEARRLIGEYLAKHPEKKDQALADEDFAAIREWIKTSA